MEEREPASEKKKSGVVAFLMDILRGVAIGVAFIIPGFSGGSVAAILGIYEKLVDAISGFFKHFKKSFLVLLPIAIGMLLGIAALMSPIIWGLKHYPIPTVTLFVGLSLGGLPSVAEKVKGKMHPGYIVAALLACAVTASMAFLPVGKNVDLFSLNVGGYFLLVLIGVVGSCALVVPGISGSMLLLILGYYEPLVDLVKENLLHGVNVGTSVLVLFCTAVGVIVGFFLISVLMKWLLKKFPRGTFAAILGFIVGSVPLVYVSVHRKYSNLSGLYANPWYWVVAVLFLLLGASISFTLYLYSKRKSSPPAERSESSEESEETSEDTDRK